MPRAGTRLLAAVAGLVFTTLCHAAPAARRRTCLRELHDTLQVAGWVLATADHAGPAVCGRRQTGRPHLCLRSRRPLDRQLGRAAGHGPRRPVGARHRPAHALQPGPGERTTPAGRFDSEPGHNDKGEAIVWIDYDASLAIHRLRPAPAHQRRPQRLDVADRHDNRISLGCVVVPVDFYPSVIQPTPGPAPRRGLRAARIAPRAGDVRRSSGQPEPLSTPTGACDLGLSARKRRRPPRHL